MNKIFQLQLDADEVRLIAALASLVDSMMTSDVKGLITMGQLIKQCASILGQNRYVMLIKKLDLFMAEIQREDEDTNAE